MNHEVQTPEEWRKNLASWIRLKLPDLTEAEQESVVEAFFESYKNDKHVILLFALSYLFDMEPTSRFSNNTQKKLYENLRNHITKRVGVI